MRNKHLFKHKIKYNEATVHSPQSTVHKLAISGLLLAMCLLPVSCQKDATLLKTDGTTAQHAATATLNPEQAIAKVLADYQTEPDRRSINFQWFLKKDGITMSDNEAQKLQYNIMSQLLMAKDVGTIRYLDYVKENKLVAPAVCNYTERMYGLFRVSAVVGKKSVSDVREILEKVEKEAMSDKTLAASDLSLIKQVVASAKVCYQFCSEGLPTANASTNGLQTREDICKGLVINEDNALWLIPSIVLTAGGLALTGPVGVVAAGILVVGAIICNFGDTIGNIWRSIINIFGGSSNPDCAAPPTIFREAAGCREINCGAYGGRDINGYFWGNSSNIQFPNGGLTTQNIIRGQVQDYTNRNTTTKLKVTPFCKGNQIDPLATQFVFPDLIQNGTPYISIVNGYTYMQTGQSAQFAASSYSRNIYDLQWSVIGSGYAHRNASTPVYATEITFYGRGTFDVVATMTNICTNESRQATWRVYVQ